MTKRSDEYYEGIVEELIELGASPDIGTANGSAVSYMSCHNSQHIEEGMDSMNSAESDANNPHGQYNDDSCGDPRSSQVVASIDPDFGNYRIPGDDSVEEIQINTQ